jgi:hypothetical protein
MPVDSESQIRRDKNMPLSTKCPLGYRLNRLVDMDMTLLQE